MEMVYPRNDVREGFNCPVSRQMRIDGIVSKELLASPDLFDNEGKPCFIVLKQGAITDLTAGCYAGLESFLCDENGVGSMEIAIYNFDKRSGPFSDHGDSGALVFDHLGRMVAIIHSGKSKSGGLASTHVTYCTPAHWLISAHSSHHEEVSLRRLQPHRLVKARTTWSAFCSSNPTILLLLRLFLASLYSVIYWLVLFVADRCLLCGSGSLLPL